MPYSPPKGTSANFTLDLGYLPPAAGSVNFALYGEYPPVLNSCDLLYDFAGSYVINSTELTWHEFIQAAKTLTLPETVEVLNGITLVYGTARYIVSAYDLVFNDTAEIVSATELSWDDVSEVVAAVALLYDFESLTPLVAAYDLYWATTPVPLVLSLSQAVSLPAADCTLSSVYRLTLLLDRDQYAITGTVTLADQGEYNLTRTGDSLTITLDGEELPLLIIDRGRQRTVDEYVYTLTVSSPAARLTSPYGVVMTDEYDGLASAIAATLCGDIALAWDTVDWFIPAGLLAGNSRQRLDILRELSEAPGAVIVSEPDGSLTIEPEYPVAVPLWSTVAPDYVLDEAADVFEATDDEQQAELYNSYQISNQSTDAAGTGLRIEVEAQDDGSQLIRVYSDPWDDTVTLRHSGDTNTVQLAIVGDVVRQVPVTLEIVDGVGSLSYPPEDLLGYSWQKSNLGTVTIDGNTVTAATAGESLLDIVYTTRSRNYLLRNSAYTDVQVIAEGREDSVVAVLISRSPGDRPGPEVFGQLILTDEVARERGRNLIDATGSQKQLINYTCPWHGLQRHGRIVEVLDPTDRPWRGMIRSQQIDIGLEGDELTALSTLIIERELEAAI